MWIQGLNCRQVRSGGLGFPVVIGALCWATIEVVNSDLRIRKLVGYTGLGRRFSLDEDGLGEELEASLNDEGDAESTSSAKRDIFCYFQGSTEWGVDHDPDYSRGVRRAIKEHHGNDPLFLIGEGKTKDYVKKMSRSLFCLAPLGFAVWSPRIYESVITGCKCTFCHFPPSFSLFH